MVTYAKKLFTGSILLLMAYSISAVVGYATRIVLARNLTLAEYGLFYAVFAFVSFFLFFRDLGLNQALTKYIPEFKVKKNYSAIKTAISSVLCWQTLSTVLLGVFFFFISDYLAENYFKEAAASSVLRIFIIYVLFSMIFLLLQSIFQGFQKEKYYFFPEPLRGLVAIGLILIFFKYFDKLTAVTWAFTLSWIVLLFVMIPLFFKIFNFFKYKTKEFMKIGGLMFAFSLPVMMNSIGGRLIAKADTLLLTYFTTLEQVGIYNVVLPTALLFLFFSESVSAVSMPLVSELWAKKDIARIKEWMYFIYKYSFVFIIPVVAILFSFPEILLRLFFGENYVPGARALQILLIGAIFYTISRLNTTTTAAMGKPMAVTKIILLSSAIGLIFNFVLIPVLGIEGAAYSTTISYLLIFALSTKQIRKSLKIKTPVRSWLLTLLASILFVISIAFVKSSLVTNVWLEALASFSTGFVVYVVCLFLFKLIDIEEIKKYVRLII